MDEIEIWERFRNGSESDFTFLYNKYAPLMYRYGYKLTKSTDLIKDSIQQVFMSIWKSRENISNPASIKNYLLKSLRCELIKKLPNDSLTVALPEDYGYHQEASYEANLIEQQTAELTKQRIAQMLSMLPVRQREIIFLKYFANLKYTEIAAVMGLTQESVYKLNYKALEKLQQLYLKMCA